MWYMEIGNGLGIMDKLARILTFVIMHARGIRRGIGLTLLVAAIAMVLLGTTIIEFQTARGAMWYWSIVFILLFSTLVVAYLDIRALRRDFRLQKKALFVATFSDEEFRRKIKEKHPDIFRKKKPQQE